MYKLAALAACSTAKIANTSRSGLPDRRLYTCCPFNLTLHGLGEIVILPRRGDLGSHVSWLERSDVMIPPMLLLEHAVALMLLWAVALLPGLALAPWLRLRVGLAAAPVIGVIYWSIAIFLLPFAHGLDVALGFLVLIAGAALWRGAHQRWPIWRRFGWSNAILVLGTVPFLSTLIVHYVPQGMDASMHTTAAALIARHGGLPTTFSPFSPDMPFMTVNLGLPATAAVAIRLGGETAAVMLASQHLTFTCMILATYVLLRRWSSRNTAATLAVASVLMARATQASIGWGGFPTVMSVSIGILAAHLLLQLARSASMTHAASTGACIAAIPLIHGIGGGTWLYCVAPFTVFVCCTLGVSLKRTLRGLVVAGLTACAVLGAYHSAGAVPVSAENVADTQYFVQLRSTSEDDRGALRSAILLLRKDVGTLALYSGWLALGVLAIFGRWRTVVLLSGAWVMLTFVVANSWWYILPASFLLYPDRVIYWAAPLSAVSLALVWRALPVRLRNMQSLNKLLATATLFLGMYFHLLYYQRPVREGSLGFEAWETLAWARSHLRPGVDFVRAEYNTAGSYLPALAMVGCTGSHNHHFLATYVQAEHRHRQPTFALCDLQKVSANDLPKGTSVFRTATMIVIKLPETEAGNASH